MTLFDLFVVKYGAKCPTSSYNTPVFYMCYVWNALKSKKNSRVITWLEYAKFSLYEKQTPRPQLMAMISDL